MPTIIIRVVCTRSHIQGCPVPQRDRRFLKFLRGLICDLDEEFSRTLSVASSFFSVVRNELLVSRNSPPISREALLPSRVAALLLEFSASKCGQKSAFKSTLKEITRDLKLPNALQDIEEDLGPEIALRKKSAEENLARFAARMKVQPCAAGREDFCGCQIEEYLRRWFFRLTMPG